MESISVHIWPLGENHFQAGTIHLVTADLRFNAFRTAPFRPKHFTPFSPRVPRDKVSRVSNDRHSARLEGSLCADARGPPDAESRREALSHGSDFRETQQQHFQNNA